MQVHLWMANTWIAEGGQSKAEMSVDLDLEYRTTTKDVCKIDLKRLLRKFAKKVKCCDLPYTPYIVCNSLLLKSWRLF